MISARSLRRAIAVVLTTGVLLASALLQAPPGEASALRLAAPESDFVVAINQHRARAGLAPLQVDASMAQAADAWTSRMVARSYIGHANTEDLWAGAPPEGRKIGENVGRGRTVESLTEAFMQSPTHRNNILDPTFTHIGVGVEVHPTSHKLYTTHRFVSLPAGSSAPAAPTAPTLASAAPAPTPAPSPTPSPTPTATPYPAPLALEPLETSAQRPAHPLQDAPTLPRGSRMVEISAYSSGAGTNGASFLDRGSRQGVN